MPQKLTVFFALIIALYSRADVCPDTVIKHFDKKISNKVEASRLFKSYFNSKNGFTPFDEKYVKLDDGPNCSAPPCFYYYDFYGFGPKKIGGYLYSNGKLVKKGYCK